MPPQIFDRKLVRLRREKTNPIVHGADFLIQRVFEDVVSRLEVTNRDFKRALFIGTHGLSGELTRDCGVEIAFEMDGAPSRIENAAFRIGGDEERLPIASQSLDLFVSILTLHTANDLVGALAQARAALKPDGLYIAALFAEDTLTTLKTALFRAETEILGGVNARVAPFVTIQDLGSVLTRAGFALPVVDIDRVSVQYENPKKLVADLRAMGETQAFVNRPAPVNRAVFNRAVQYFSESGGKERFNIAYATGWAPHDSQQKPLTPGSGKTSLADAVNRASLDDG